MYEAKGRASTPLRCGERAGDRRAKACRNTRDVGESKHVAKGKLYFSIYCIQGVNAVQTVMANVYAAEWAGIMFDRRVCVQACECVCPEVEDAIEGRRRRK